jgi:hypothetical protein
VGTLLGFATAPGKLAADSGGGANANSAYARHLARQMVVPGLSVEQVFKRVREGVVRDTDGAQVPWESCRRRSSSRLCRGRRRWRWPPPRRRPRWRRGPRWPSGRASKAAATPTSAGRFRALKVVLKGQARARGAGRGIETEQVVWYAPQARRMVKATVTTTQGGNVLEHVTLELVELRLQ